MTRFLPNRKRKLYLNLLFYLKVMNNALQFSSCVYRNCLVVERLICFLFTILTVAFETLSFFSEQEARLRRERRKNILCYEKKYGVILNLAFSISGFSI